MGARPGGTRALRAGEGRQRRARGWRVRTWRCGATNGRGPRGAGPLCGDARPDPGHRCSRGDRAWRAGQRAGAAGRRLCPEGRGSRRRVVAGRAPVQGPRAAAAKPALRAPAAPLDASSRLPEALRGRKASLDPRPARALDLSFPVSEMDPARQADLLGACEEDEGLCPCGKRGCCLRSWGRIKERTNNAIRDRGGQGISSGFWVWPPHIDSRQGEGTLVHSSMCSGGGKEAWRGRGEAMLPTLPHS